MKRNMCHFWCIGSAVFACAFIAQSHASSGTVADAKRSPTVCHPVAAAQGSSRVPSCITPAATMTVHYEAMGAVTANITLVHLVDDSHACLTSQLPWAHIGEGSQAMEVPQGPPTYEVQYDTPAPRAGSHFRLSAFGYVLGQVTQNDAADDWIELWAGGGEWVGHGSGDPTFTIQMAFSSDGQSGTFNARHLRAVSAGIRPNGDTRTIDVHGDWRCR